MNIVKEKIKYIVAVLLYGTIGVLLRYVNAPSEFVVLCRGLLGTITIAVILLLRREKIDLHVDRRSLVLLIVSGACLGLNWVFLFDAYRATTVAIASLCYYTAPIMVIIVSPFIFKEKLTGKKLLCVAASFIGIVLVSGVMQGSRSDVNMRGVLLSLAAALGFMSVVICNKKIHGVQPLVKSMIQLFVSALIVLPYVIYRDGGQTLQLDTRSIFLVVILGIVHTGIAYLLYFSSMEHLPIQTVALVGYLDPVESVVLSALVLHETLSIFGIVGAVLILGSALFSELMPTKEVEA